MIELLIWFIVFAVIVWLVFFILGQLPIPAPIKTVVTVVFALIFLLILISHFGLLEPGHYRLRP
jgi:hypothetical protein